jgi:(p)ppGpp synthase/HD superfamily hydrolase
VAKLEDAILLAVQAHRGQTDKNGLPYILHPLRMMTRMRTEDEMIVAVLHDVVEDTEHTLDDLRQAGYAAHIVEAIDCLTRREDESYEDFTQRARSNPLALRVKLADLEDNMDIRRIADPQERDFERLKRYRRAWRALTGA